jgi:hypothetical protein
MTTNRNQQPSTVTVHVPLTFTVRGGRRTILGAAQQPNHTPPRTRFDDSVIKALARAYRWKRKLDDGTYSTIADLAKAAKINESYVTRLLRLNLLAPDIVEAALNGQTTLTVESISKPMSPIWHEQRMRLPS